MVYILHSNNIVTGYNILYIGIVYRLGIINQVRNDYFTYPVWQRSACGQRGPDNRGCTVAIYSK